MKLNIFTDISLKSLMYLKQAQNLVTINEIALQFSIIIVCFCNLLLEIFEWRCELINKWPTFEYIFYFGSLIIVYLLFLMRLEKLSFESK